MEIGIVRPVSINDEMRTAYLEYAMSVIVSRALPDSRDGLKPVQVRIMYGMWDMAFVTARRTRSAPGSSAMCSARCTRMATQLCMMRWLGWPNPGICATR